MFEEFINCGLVSVEKVQAAFAMSSAELADSMQPPPNEPQQRQNVESSYA